MQMQAKKDEVVYKYVDKITTGQRTRAWMSRVILWIFVAIVLFPILAIISASLTSGAGFATTELLPKSVTFENYTNVFKDTDFVIWIKNSMMLCISVAVIQIAITIPAAFAFSRLRFAMRGQGLMGLLILQMFPTTMALPAIITVCINLQELTAFGSFKGVSGTERT